MSTEIQKSTLHFLDIFHLCVPSRILRNFLCSVFTLNVVTVLSAHALRRLMPPVGLLVSMESVYLNDLLNYFC
jgi:hypothetical protein